MLKKIRITLAAIMLTGITLLFIGIGHEWWGWMAKIQFLPSCIALNFAVIIGTTLITVLIGRVYCSVICPMGIFQDLVNWISSKRKGKKRRFSFHREHKIMRYLFLGAFVGAYVASVQLVISILAPYSAYGRMISSAIHPYWGITAIVAIATFVIITAISFFFGREYCNSVCPVGTVLSLFARFSLFRPMIDKDKCVHCGSCEKKCKASCIYSLEQKIDYSRCVDCFDCISDCKVGAIKFKFAYGKKKDNVEKEDTADSGRRAFLVGAAVLGTSLISQAQEKLDGGLAPIIEKQNGKRTKCLLPPGAINANRYFSLCTACQLCVSSCPNHVLRPNTNPSHLMKPVMEYDKGYCRPECTACSDVCPTGALLKISKEEKTSYKIGTARVNLDLCVVNRDHVSCGNCARHCPTGAIRITKDGTPAVLPGRCIGCGACENLCPSRPISAIIVDGLASHKRV